MKNPAKFVILEDRSANQYLVEVPIKTNPDGSVMVHCVRIPTLSGIETSQVGIKKKFAAKFKIARPFVLSMSAKTLRSCKIIEVHSDHDRVAEAAISLSKKSLPICEGLLVAADGREFKTWMPVREKRASSHRLSWKILSCYWAMQSMGASLKSDCSQFEEFYRLMFRYSQDDDAPSEETFKKAAQELGIRFPRKVQGSKKRP